MTQEQTQVFEYIKSLSHLYIASEKYVWCEDKKKTVGVYLYKDNQCNRIQGRCDGCGMIVGR